MLDEATTYRTKEQVKKRGELEGRFVGDLVPEQLSDEVIEIIEETGIQPPAWFNTRGTMLSQVNAVETTRARR